MAPVRRQENQVADHGAGTGHQEFVVLQQVELV